MHLTLHNGQSQEICIVIPTLNEEKTIYETIITFPRQLFDKSTHVLVIDGNSTDETVRLAKRAGAQVILQKTRGKGIAIKEGMEAVMSEIYVFIDGDGTYLPTEVDLVVKPILEDKADMVIGSRFKGEIEKDAMTWINRIGNKIFNFMVRRSIGAKITDMLSGYRAIRGKCLDELVLLSRNFEIETEITLESYMNAQRIMEVPITYKKRTGTRSKLRPFRDGIKIFRSIIFFIMNSRPLFFFSIIASTFFLLGLYPAIYVLVEKITLGEIYHIPSVILSSLLFTSGALVLIFGLVAELVVTNRRRIEYGLKKMMRKGYIE